MLTTSVWTIVFTNAPVDISLMWYQGYQNRFHYFKTVKKKNKPKKEKKKNQKDGMLKYELWELKNLLQQKSQLLQKPLLWYVFLFFSTCVESYDFMAIV